LQDEFTSTNVTNEVLEAQEVEVFWTADDDVAVGILLVELVDFHH
jgi:hypothetical protein